MITGVVIAFSLAFVQSTSAEYLGKSVCQDIWNATANNLDIGQEIRVHADAEDRRRVNRRVRGHLFQLEPASSHKIWDGQFQKFRDLLRSYQWIRRWNNHYKVWDEINIKSHTTEAKARSFFRELIAQTDGPIKQGFKYLRERGLLPPLVTTLDDFRGILETMWFGVPFGQSDGFLHTFVGDKRNYNVLKYTGFHNWYQLHLEQIRRRIGDVYMGYDLFQEDTQPAFMPAIYFDWKNYGKKHGSSMFVGTSPGFEIALYSICFIEFPGKFCTCHIGRSTVTVQTYPEMGANNLPILGEIATAYPVDVVIEVRRCAPYNPAYRTNCGWTGIRNSECKSRGCCYDIRQANTKRCFYPKDHKCDGIHPANRNDCGLVSRQQCERVNHCCFDDSVANVPFCFKGNL